MMLTDGERLIVEAARAELDTPEKWCRGAIGMMDRSPRYARGMVAVVGPSATLPFMLPNGMVRVPVPDGPSCRRSDVVSVCVIGSLWRAGAYRCFDLGMPFVRVEAVWPGAISALADAASRLFPRRYDDETRVLSSVNDHGDTTHDDVLAIYDKLLADETVA